jgi:hypothetical protein
MPPKIKTLIYKVISGESVDYCRAQQIIEETEDFTLRVNHKEASFEFKRKIPSEKEALAIADDFIKRWEVLLGLEHGPGDLRFKFDYAEYETTPEEGAHRPILSVSGSEQTLFSGKVEVFQHRSKLPNRPHHFKLSPDVTTMYERYRQYRQGKESLTSMAFMCLTILEVSAKAAHSYCRNNTDRGKASFQYKIEFDVLKHLGMLTSTRGDQTEARKAPNDGVFNPLSHEDREWIVRAIKVLIRRAGEYAYDPGGYLKKITMNDI